MPGRILVVEDNPDMAEMIIQGLGSAKFATLATDTAAQGKRLFDREIFDLVLLDVNLKDGTGYEVVEHIRKHAGRSATPIIMLTALDEIDDKQRGFSAGADYYLTKPISVRELILWVRALLQRARQDWSNAATIGVEGLLINPETRVVQADGKLVRGLTAKEFDLLNELARSSPKTVRREELMERIWGGGGPRTNSLEVHVRSLRKKLGAQASSRIVTVKGVGYRLE